MVQPNAELVKTTKKSGMVRRPKAEITPAPTQQAQAIAIQELNVSFDPDLRLAMLQRLVAAQSEIKQLAEDEEKLAKVIELGRLAATEKSRETGIQAARKEFAIKAEKYKQQEQQRFLDSELPELISACGFLPINDLKTTVESFASRLDIKLIWEETDEGIRWTVA